MHPSLPRGPPQLARAGQVEGRWEEASPAILRGACDEMPTLFLGPRGDLAQCSSALPGARLQMSGRFSSQSSKAQAPRQGAPGSAVYLPSRESWLPFH